MRPINDTGSIKVASAGTNLSTSPLPRGKLPQANNHTDDVVDNDVLLPT